MDRLNNIKYKLDLSAQEMKEIGFKYDSVVGEYTYKFPVYKSQKKKPMIFCRFIVNEETKVVSFNVYNLQEQLYGAFYNREYDNNNIIPIVDKNIEKEMKKIGARKVKCRK